MNYLEVFPSIALVWGVLGVAVGLKGEVAATDKYTVLTKLWLVIGWAYLAACVPIFQESQHFSAQMTFFYAAFAVILSLEVWIIFLGSLIAIALAKKAHDHEFSSLMLQWHLPIKRVLKPMLQVLSVLQIVNVLYYMLSLSA